MGACPRCQGFGNTIDYDLDLVIPDHGLSLDEGVVVGNTIERLRPSPSNGLRSTPREKSISPDMAGVSLHSLPLMPIRIRASH